MASFLNAENPHGRTERKFREDFLRIILTLETLRLARNYLRENFTWGKEPRLYLLDGAGHAGGGIRQELRREQALALALSGNL